MMRGFYFSALLVLLGAAALAGCAGGQLQQAGSDSTYLAFPPLKRDVQAEQWTARGDSWQVVGSPNKGSGLGNVLNAVADVSSGDVWAVGAWPARSPYLTDTLAEHWNGTKWSIVHTPLTGMPTAQLNSIAAVASNAVWAAGYAEDPGCVCAQAIVDFWNGSTWTRSDTPNPGIADFLYGISAVSTSEIWAVGNQWPNQGTHNPLILRWDGTSWTTVSLNQYQDGELDSVYAPTHNDAWAFGYYNKGVMLAIHWNGKSWTQVSFPEFAQIDSASGTSPKDVWAAGGYYCGAYCNPEARLFHWNGRQWSTVIGGAGGASWIYGISAIRPDDAWYTGFGAVFPSQNVSNVTYHWNGAKWTDIVNPDQTGYGQLHSVSERTSSDAWVAGEAGSKGTFTMHHVAR